MSKINTFTAFGRDVQAAADSLDSAAGQAVKAVVQWFADDSFLDAQWNVTFEKDATGASVTFAVVPDISYAEPEFPSAIEPAPESVINQVMRAEGYVDPEADAQLEPTPDTTA